MIIAHLTDTEIQLYAAGSATISNQMKAHVQNCTSCRTNIANYQLLFNGIHNDTKPQFDFDLTSLVLEKLPAPKHAFPWAAVLMSALSITLIALLTIFFWPYLDAVITGAPTVLITTAITVAVVVLTFQAIEMIKSHQKQLYALLNTKALQL